ncbi:MAG: hypothetical protein DHS20C17_14460 [Cyclobacteriaceae bacterium]|nr:MAG: hypothetical protein DHS20C17_14460 [Cyclobacteriaceae bacterium]
MNQHHSFTGPLFIVGMPRSGTKLLRGLLLQHDKVGIPLVETGFLPFWVRRWESYGDLSDFENFKKFYKSNLKIPYFFYMKYEGTRHHGQLISCETWYSYCQNYTVAGVFEALLRHDAGVDYHSNGIWGDKSPGYITHIPLLFELYPKARVVHIVRDVRDYSLSIKTAWNKNPLRAAQRWSDWVSKIKFDSKLHQQQYFEIKYEDLLDEPVKCLEELCDFIGIQFSTEMLKLDSSTENLGDSKGHTKIVGANKNKFRERMDSKMQKRIESISKTAMSLYGYPPDFTVNEKQLSKAELYWYQVADAYHLAISKSREIKGLGITGAVKFHLQHYLANKSN